MSQSEVQQNLLDSTTNPNENEVPKSDVKESIVTKKINNVDTPNVVGTESKNTEIQNQTINMELKYRYVYQNIF